MDKRMRTTLSLIRREFTAYFLGPVGYVALVLFLAGMGVLFRFTFDLLTAPGAKGIEFPMQGLLGNVGFWLIFWVIPPLVTMRLFAEERSTGTLEMLLTAPVRDWQVVVCKFIACLGFYVLMWIPTLLYLPVLLDVHAEWPGWDAPRQLITGGLLIPIGLLVVVFAAELMRLMGWIVTGAGVISLVMGCIMLKQAGSSFCNCTLGIDPMPVVTSYIGLLFAGAMFLALGLLVSSLVRSQIVAALLSLAINLIFILGGLLILGGFYAPPADAASPAYRLMNFLSVPLHFSQDFSRGLIDSRHLILYSSVTLAGLFLTARSLERRRWQ
jgi:ABC-type transport system involved in multi-copper enzyme maturation permease subunit